MGRLDNWVKSFLKSCISKKAYPSVEKAKKVADKVLKERGVQLHCYWCEQCGRYHLTKRLPKNMKEERWRFF